ncbi:PAS domain-containing protein [Streptomyces flaveolus]|uniref:PAS domain-containing protein n=1 Tax=Streptomyces flaveolus TaxID=67297 RepID=A0ABV3A9I6_9ACTN|nr:MULTISPECIES: PAS domain-containing protein [Streptomyces]KMS88332.1 DNA-binding protein [Streptomyces regensis]KOG74139.1 DNA-binding protein [Streptomyces antibioticus]MBG7696946.1 PAS domain-containing protein [Streptomyces sp. MC1]
MSQGGAAEDGSGEDDSGEDRADEHLIREAEKIAVALGRMFPGLCEVVLHDLRDPDHAIRAIENNLSGRQVGDSATELGLARIADPQYPSVIQNYPNQFPDGRPAKSTSIGIKNAAGEYVAALCLNLDVSVLSPVTLALSNLVATDTEHRDRPLETLRDRAARELRQAVEARAAERAATPRSLSREDKKALVRQLQRDGYFDSRDAAQTIADLLGVSRATVYNYAK